MKLLLTVKNADNLNEIYKIVHPEAPIKYRDDNIPFSVLYSTIDCAIAATNKLMAPKSDIFTQSDYDAYNDTLYCVILVEVFHNG